MEWKTIKYTHAHTHTAPSCKVGTLTSQQTLVWGRQRGKREVVTPNWLKAPWCYFPRWMNTSPLFSLDKTQTSRSLYHYAGFCLRTCTHAMPLRTLQQLLLTFLQLNFTHTLTHAHARAAQLMKGLLQREKYPPPSQSSITTCPLTDSSKHIHMPMNVFPKLCLSPKTQISPQRSTLKCTPALSGSLLLNSSLCSFALVDWQLLSVCAAVETCFSQLSRYQVLPFASLRLTRGTCCNPVFILTFISPQLLNEVIG